MKTVIGIIFAISAAALAIMTFTNPEEYDIVGHVVTMVTKPPFELHWLIAVVIFLAIAAFDVFAAVVTAESNIVSLIGMIAFAAAALVITVLRFFEIYPSEEYSVWYNVVPIAILIVSLIAGILNDDVSLSDMFITFAGYATAGFTGAIVGCLIVAIISYILLILGIGIMLFIAWAMLGGR